MPAWNWWCILVVEKMALLSSAYSAINLRETEVVTSCWVAQAIYQVHMPTCSHTATWEAAKSLTLMSMNVSKSLKKVWLSMLRGQIICNNILLKCRSISIKNYIFGLPFYEIFLLNKPYPPNFNKVTSWEGSPVICHFVHDEQVYTHKMTCQCPDQQ